MNCRLLQVLVLALCLFAAGCGRRSEAPAGTPVSIHTTPAGATVLVDGQAVGETPIEGKSLPPGPHMLAFQLSGYETVWEPVPADHSGSLELDIQLMPLTAPLYITSEPKQALVRFNGSDRGETPLILNRVEKGEHTLVLSMPGYADKTVRVEVKSPRPLHVSESLESVLGGLSVQGAPPGSRLTLNGREYGSLPDEENRPLVIRGLEAGPYELGLAKPGYRSANQRVLVTRNQMTEVRLDPLEALPGEVRITSEPTNATVTDVDSNTVLGQTPLKLENLPDGTLHVRVSKDGYEPQTTRIAVSHGLYKEIDLQLLIDSGTLSLITSPPGITVHVDGKRAGITLRADNPEVSTVFEVPGLSPGPHRLSLVHPLYERYERNVFIERGKTEHLGTIELKKIWRPTHILTLKNGRELKGIVAERMADGSIVFEREPNIKVTYKADEIAKLSVYKELP